MSRESPQSPPVLATMTWSSEPGVVARCNSLSYLPHIYALLKDIKVSLVEFQGCSSISTERGCKLLPVGSDGPPDPPPPASAGSCAASWWRWGPDGCVPI